MVAILEKLKLSLNRGNESTLFAKIAEESRARGEVKKALKICADGIEKYPNYATGHYILARCYLEEEMNTEAKESLAEALKFAPHHIAALTELASLYQIENNSSQALHYYRQALAIDPLNERIQSLIQSISGEPGPSVPPYEEVIEESVDPQVNTVGTIVVEQPEVDQLRPAIPDAEMETTEEDLSEPAFETEVLLQEEQPTVIVAPSSPQSDLPNSIDLELVTVEEEAQGIEIEAQGLWVSEMFGENVPRSSATDASGEEPWPASLFSTLMELGTRTDMVTFGGGPSEGSRKSTFAKESEGGIASLYATEIDLNETDQTETLDVDDVEQWQQSPGIEDSTSATPSEDGAPLDEEPEEEAPFWSVPEAKDEAVSPQMESPESTDDQPDSTIPGAVNAESNVVHSGIDSDMGPDTVDKADPIGETDLVEESTVDSDESESRGPSSIPPQDSSNDRTSIGAHDTPDSSYPSSQPGAFLESDSQENDEQPPLEIAGDIETPTSGWPAYQDELENHQDSEPSAAGDHAPGLTDENSEDEESEDELVEDSSDSPSFNEDPFAEEMDEPTRDEYSVQAGDGTTELTLKSDFRPPADHSKDHPSDSPVGDPSDEQELPTDSFEAEEDDSTIEDRPDAAEISGTRADNESDRYLDQFFTDSFSFAKGPDPEDPIESLSSDEDHSPPETLPAPAVPGPQSDPKGSDRPIHQEKPVTEAPDETSSSVEPPGLVPDDRIASSEDRSQSEPGDSAETMGPNDDQIADAPQTTPDDRIDESPLEEATGQSTISPRDPRSEAIPTATLAELYVRQGLIDRAIAVYLTLIEHDPTNPDIHKRLSELFVIKSQGGRS